MNEDDFAKSLLAHERKEWQDSDKIIRRIGIKEGMVVADLACGPGFFTIPIAGAVGKLGKVYAIDSSKVMLRYLHSSLKRSRIDKKIVEIIEADITSNTGIPEFSADIILLANILHDIENPKNLFHEIERISKQETRVVDIDWKKAESGFGPPIEIRLTERESKKIFSENGYIAGKSIDAGQFHYGFVCTRRA